MFSRETYTLHFDGSHNNKAHTPSAGCIIRDSKGDLVVAAAYNLTKPAVLPYYTAAIVAAIGLRNGLNLAKERSLNLAFIKGHNKEVIDLVLQSRCQPGPHLFDSILEIKKLIMLGSAQVMLIDREDNKVADKFAYVGTMLRTEIKVFVRTDPLPFGIPDLIREEKPKEGSSNLALTAGRTLLAVGGLAMNAYTYFSGGSSSASIDQQKANNAPNPARPRPDFYTLQYFGSGKTKALQARGGCIILKNRGEFFVAGSYNLNFQYYNCHITIAEAIALKMGLKLAKDNNNVTLDFIQGRDAEVRDRVLGFEKKRPRTGLSAFIKQVQFALYEQGAGREDTLELVSEDGLKVARALADIGGTQHHEAVIYKSLDELPPSIAHLVNLELYYVDKFME